MGRSSVRTLYNGISGKYNGNRGKASNDVTELPVVLKLLGDIKDKEILDMGCGLGKHAKEFIKKGANVTGFDASEKMVLIAKEYCKGKGQFFRGNYETVSFADNSFDVINASMSINYSNKLETVFQNTRKWLKPHGIFTFSIPHPIWLLSRVSNMDYSKERLIWINIDSYDVEIFNRYHKLDTYIQQINRNNFKLLNMIETTIPRKYKGWSEEKYRLPNTIVFKLQKV